MLSTYCGKEVKLKMINCFGEESNPFYESIEKWVLTNASEWDVKSFISGMDNPIGDQGPNWTIHSPSVEKKDKMFVVTQLTITYDD